MNFHPILIKTTSDSISIIQNRYLFRCLFIWSSIPSSLTTTFSNGISTVCMIVSLLHSPCIYIVSPTLTYLILSLSLYKYVVSPGVSINEVSYSTLSDIMLNVSCSVSLFKSLGYLIVSFSILRSTLLNLFSALCSKEH